MSTDLLRRRILVKGSVQGVGFRPFVWNHATALGLVGWVLNGSSGVTIEIQGTVQQIENFLKGFEQATPPLAIIDSFETKSIPIISEQTFSILQSTKSKETSTPITPDISVCDDCLQELTDCNNRRFQYPFINCTNCGPRFTIIKDIPYDRPLTTMKSFVMCEQCQQEFDDPLNRRFHAQPNACPECGPRIWFESGASNPGGDDPHQNSSDAGHEAIEQFKKAIQQSQIVAVKGVGGFHLVCDATNSLAIEKLRERKGRIAKPFAMMVANVAQAELFAMIGEHERQLLESAERPIVLLQKKSECDRQEMLNHVAPGNDFIGVMLPYSPLHYLLIGESSPLLMTSGNVADEPIVKTNCEARERLSSLADSFLFHDRDIHVVCDDSVVRCVEDGVLPIRRSRGYAPLPVKLREPGPSVLAVGGEIKTTFCVTKGDYAYLSQHIGDMGNLETLRALQHNVEHFIKLFRVDIHAVVADLHPGYLSAQWAADFAKSLGVPFMTVQHHYAHAVSLLAENHWPEDRPIIACCFDGTGYGIDEAIWGGEFLVASGREFERIAQLKYSPLPGGDSSIQKPYRIALAHLWANELVWDEHLPCVDACPPAELALLQQQLSREINCVPSSSMGRLFDAVASLIGIRHEVTYEAQAAMEMEAMAAKVIKTVDTSAYSFEIQHHSLMKIETRKIMQSICDDIFRGIPRQTIAAQFHHAVASMVTVVCESSRKELGINQVGLTGGVFQNVLLLQLVRRRLLESGFEVLAHTTVPPNDGGLALGQAVVARNSITREASD